MQSLKPQVFAPYLVPTIEAAMHAIQMTDFSAIVTPIMLPDGMIQNWLVPIYEHLFIRNVVSKTIVISHDHQLKTITQLMRRHVNHRLLDPVDPHELVRILEPWALEFFYIQSCYTVLNALRKNHCNQSLKSALNHHLDPELISLL
jgi:response regulator of citrate/malate metabolism